MRIQRGSLRYHAYIRLTVGAVTLAQSSQNNIHRQGENQLYLTLCRAIALSDSDDILLPILLHISEVNNADKYISKINKTIFPSTHMTTIIDRKRVRVVPT